MRSAERERGWYRSAMRTEQVTKFPVPPVSVLRGAISLLPWRHKVQVTCSTFDYKTLISAGIEQPGHSFRFSQGQLTPQKGDTMFLSSLAVLFIIVTFSSNLAMAVNRENRLQTLSRGWGDDIMWVQTYEEGLYNAKKSNKPLMVIHHLEDCQYCQALRKVFAESEELQKLAKENFIMLNLMHETTDKNLAPDGQYVPRIMFIDPSLTVRADITGRYSNRLYTYEPQDVPVLIENMKKAMRLIQTEL